MSPNPDPLPVLVAGLHPQLVAALQVKLLPHPHRVEIRAVCSLHHAVHSGAHCGAVVVVGTGAARIDEEPDLVGLLRSSSPVPVVILSEVDDDASLLAALDRGAAGYLLSEITGEELVAALHRVSDGEIVVDGAMGGRIISRLAKGTWPVRSPLDRTGLRPRESQVLESLLEGRTNREIARNLNLGEETVKTHLRSIYRKLGARDRSQAISIMLRRR